MRSRRAFYSANRRGDCFVWGVNKYGKTGNNSENQPQNSPFKLKLPNIILDIQAESIIM